MLVVSIVIDFISYSLYYLCWITNRHAARRYIFHNHATSSNGYVISDGYARQDRYTSTYPAVVSYCYRTRPFLPSIPFHRVCGVTRRIDADVRPDKAVVTNGHHGFIEYRPVEVGKKSLAHLDVFAVVAEEWLVDGGH